MKIFCRIARGRAFLQWLHCLGRNVWMVGKIQVSTRQNLHKLCLHWGQNSETRYGSISPHKRQVVMRIVCVVEKISFGTLGRGSRPKIGPPICGEKIFLLKNLFGS